MNTISSKYTNDSVVTTISNLYTNPAQRSSTLGRKKVLPSGASKATEQDDSHHWLTGDLVGTKNGKTSGSLDGRKPSSSALETMKEDKLERPLTSDLVFKKNTKNTSAQGSSVDTKRDSVTPVATVRAVKGVETWC